MLAHSNGRRLAAAAALALIVSLPAAPSVEAAWWSSSPIPPAPVPEGSVTLAQSTPELAQQSMRIDRVEEQMRQLNGRIDELTYQIQQLQDLLRRSREDTEFRLQDLEGGAPRKRSEAPLQPGAGPSDQTAITTGPADAPAELENGFSMDASGDDYGQPPQVLGTIPADIGGGAAGGSGPLDLSAIARGDDGYAGTDPLMPSELPGSGPTDVAVLSSPVVAPTAPPPAGGTDVATAAIDEDPRAEYNRAYDYIRQGDYQMAEAGFRRFIERNAKSPLAGDAHYWLGESLYARNQFRDAADSFLATYRDYPGSSKAPQSLLKLGLSLEGLGETDAACATYRELEKKYGSTAGALMEQVAEEKTRAGC